MAGRRLPGAGNRLGPPTPPLAVLIDALAARRRRPAHGVPRDELVGEELARGGQPARGESLLHAGDQVHVDAGHARELGEVDQVVRKDRAQRRRSFTDAVSHADHEGASELSPVRAARRGSVQRRTRPAHVARWKEGVEHDSVRELGRARERTRTRDAEVDRGHDLGSHLGHQSFEADVLAPVRIRSGCRPRSSDGLGVLAHQAHRVVVGQPLLGQRDRRTAAQPEHHPARRRLGQCRPGHRDQARAAREDVDRGASDADLLRGEKGGRHCGHRVSRDSRLRDPHGFEAALLGAARHIGNRSEVGVAKQAKTCRAGRHLLTGRFDLPVVFGVAAEGGSPFLAARFGAGSSMPRTPQSQLCL